MHVPYLDKLLKKTKLSGSNVLIILSVIVGIATALGAIGFIILIKYMNTIFFGETAKTLTETIKTRGFDWWLLAIPMIGGLFVGPIVFKFAIEAKGHGVPEVMNAVARLGGIIRPRVAAAKAVASAICIGSGGSAGREGPIVQIGAAIGSTIGQMFRMSGERVKVLVGCGAAAGITSVFNAPIAGVFFSLEIILGDFAIKTFSPVLISSVVASVVTRAFLGNHPAFQVPSDYTLVSAWEIPLYMIMGVVLGGLGVMFTKTLDKFEDIFDALKLPSVYKPAIGGLFLGAIALIFPQILADGYQTIQLTLYGKVGIGLMFVLIFLKMLATSFTLGSGNSGGIFAPSLFMGAAAGGAFGYLAHYLFPQITATQGAYALVGMAGMMAAATHAPMTAMLIIFEMTTDYRMILPLMMTVVFSTLVSRKLFNHSIYTVKLFRRGIDIKGGKDINILKSHQVREIMDENFETIDASTPLAEIFRIIESTNETYFIVVDKQEHLKGVITFQDIRSVLSQHSLDYLIIAQDLIKENTNVLNFDDDLEKAYQMFSMKDLRLIPVVNEYDSNKIIGVVRRDELIDAYNKWLIDTLRK
ncbi:MAG: chloride channel protein [FCB group bacterium]|nr:chloride channel protein [FCB group bacterium]